MAIELVINVLSFDIGVQDLTILSMKADNAGYISQVKFGRTIDYTTEIRCWYKDIKKY